MWAGLGDWLSSNLSAIQIVLDMGCGAPEENISPMVWGLLVKTGFMKEMVFWSDEYDFERERKKSFQV